MTGPAPEAPLRLLLVGSLPPPLGGTTVSLRQLLRELSARSDVHVEHVETSPGRESGGAGRGRVGLRLLRRLARGLGEVDVASLHASPPGIVAFGPPLLALCRLQRRPLVLRGFGGCFDTDWEAMSPLARRALRLAFRADRVLLQTRAQLAYFRERIPEAHLEWFANSRPRPAGVPTDPPPDAPPRFAFVGHVKSGKGVPELVEAARRLEGRCRIDVFGPLLEGFTRDAVEGAANVRYRGVLPPERVIETLGGYHALVLPTYHFGEGYPGVVLEAYAAGVPVVTTRWRALPEIVQEGESGLLVEPRDPAALAAALARLCDEPETRAALGRGARAQADRFASERWTQRFVEICREVARQRG